MIGTFFAASSIGLPSALNSVGAITTAAGFSETAFSRIVISPLMSDSDWAPSSGTLTSKVFGGLAGAGKHDLPIGRGRVLDDDGNRRLVGGVTGRAIAAASATTAVAAKRYFFMPFLLR